MDNEVAKFLSAARGDMRTVEQLNSFPVHKQYQSICFHCQQAAEKVLKALWKSDNLNKEIVRTHDVEFLLDSVSNVYDVPKQMHDWAEVLTMYEANSRYEFAEKIDEAQTDMAVVYAKKIYNWALDKIDGGEEFKY